jgi:hypothetical protein
MKKHTLTVVLAFVLGASANSIATETKTTEHQASEDHGNHVHGKKCGHKAKKHGDHVDYKHDGHLHKKHDSHYDECQGESAAKTEKSKT